ncbi:MCP four helix bundle domain-containing protein [Propionispora vibrioides]|jgi:methyl-accepting chemotaxis protein|uniref:Sensor domain CHASE3-containing protein n=1 Tax=Propionispora vibrioides TaxID=112903 RepID=A0A1H8UA52_9FIRM|nr:methyl-accepting chemotaxis protein [Propionispora vibrioides]SEP00109.1 sensor domain CHASE3-containing protein [Propionispora vibrioides]
MKIRNKIIAGYLVVSVLVLAVAISAAYGFNSIKSSFQLITDQSEAKIIYLREIQFYFTGQANDERGFLLTTGPEFRQEITQKADNIKKRITLIQGLIDNNEHAELLKKIDDAHSRFTQINYKVIDLYNGGQAEAAKKLSFGEGRSTRKDLETSFNQLVKLTEEDIAHKKQSAQNTVDRLLLFIALVSISVIVIGIGIGIYLARSITKPINTITDHINQGDIGFAATVTVNDEVGLLVKAFEKLNSVLRHMVADIQSHSEQVAASSQELTATAEQSSLAASQVAAGVEQIAHQTEQQNSFAQ